MPEQLKRGPRQVAQLFEGLGRRDGVLYDASGGTGKSANAFHRMGFKVVCSTYAEEPALDAGIEWHKGVDLNATLPFARESFDYAVLQEVIEHLENPAHVIREFNRILKPGGLWALTTPNALCLRSRLHFLLSGFVKGRRRPANYNIPPGDYTNLFIPSFTMLHYLLWMYGFRVVATGRGQRKWSSYLLLPILGPWIALWTWYYTRAPGKYDSPIQREASADMRRLLLSAHFLLDENMALLLEKTHDIEHLYAAGAPQAAAAERRHA